ncbi:MAG TPA: DNA polymerase I, partial [Candidatus Paceibacterota bacterium]|nr:DNA polymerase I [Candidatus Paceibacterota bacterium]
DYVAATFDLPGTTFRHEEFAEYKSHRIKAPDELYLQIPYIKEILTSFGIPIFEKAGFEADDLIGSLARHTRDMEDIQVVIMTGDLDTLQLVQDDKVVVFTLRKGVTDTFIYNEKEVKARYDLKPAQIIDFKGLKGDPSDNIPGVPGVGDKTASSLVKQFGSIEGIYEAIEKKGSDSKIENPRFANRAKREANRDKKPKLLTPKLIEKLETNKDQALFSKRLATIICDVDFEFDFDKTEWRKHMAREQLEKLLKDLALFSLVKRLDEIDGEAKSAPVVRPAAAGPTAAGQLLDSDSAVESALAGIEKSGQAAIDIQAGLILATNDGKEAFGFPETMLKGKLKEKFSDILTNPRIEKTFCDEKEICRWALERGMELQDCSFDIHLAAYLINSDIHDFSLERLYFAEFEHDMSAEPLYRPIALAKLRERYQSKLSALGLEKVFKTIELPLGPILAGMEQKGIKIDREAIKKLSVEIDKELAELEKQIYGHAGSPFNISSPKQLSTILFEKLAIKGKVRKTGKGAISTAAGELEKLIEEHPIIALILKYRELQKLKTTYIEPFPSLIAADGRLHTTYNQNGAVTGRLSSQDPNLQNIPIKTELGQKFRSAFIADNGFKLLSLDYSQLELRIVAHISGDQAMTEAFRTGLDIHTRTAAAIFKVKPDQVTANMRRQAKVLNFGLIYGMGVLGFQRASGVDRDTARE